ncbi:MAG: rhomboid family intramembrane serine protease [Verrucomicrobiota bacterium]
MASPIITATVTPAARPLLQSIKEHAVLLFGLLAIMWAIEVVDLLLPMVDLDQFGIRPRTERGLVGILLSPFLHLGFGHLISNSIPFLLLGGLVMTRGCRQFLLLSLWVTIVGGCGVWLLGASGTVHLGASLLIFGYLGFLLSRGIAERSVGGVLFSVGLLFGYGGMLYGVLPGRPGISWLGHLCGFLAGVAAAWLLTKPSAEAARITRA